MPKIVRLTLFKIPDESMVQEAIQMYNTLAQDAKKVRQSMTVTRNSPPIPFRDLPTYPLSRRVMASTCRTCITDVPCTSTISSRSGPQIYSRRPRLVNKKNGVLMASTLSTRAEQCPWQVTAGNTAAARRNGVGVTRLQQRGKKSESRHVHPRDA
jgi:hypothetical protein